jgi:hypothetical protein
LAFAGLVLRFFSYLYHLAFSLFLLGLSIVAYTTGMHTLRLEMTPWSGETLSRWLMGLALFGLVAILLALRGKLKALFLLYAAFVAVMLIRGYFLQTYRFRGAEELRFASYLSAGALLALAGAWSAFRKRRLR